MAERLLHAATVLLCAGERQRGMLPSQVVLVQLAFAVVQETAGLLGHVQVVDLQRRAGRRGALGLRVQGGGRRRQRALPPDTSPISTAFSLGQLTKNTPRRRCHIFTVFAVRVRRVAILRCKVALVVNVVIDNGVCPESLRGFPNVHPQGIGRSLLLRLDPSGPRIHWSRVYRQPLLEEKNGRGCLATETSLSGMQMVPTALLYLSSSKRFMSANWFDFSNGLLQLHSPCKPTNMAHPTAQIPVCACPRDLNLRTRPSAEHCIKSASQRPRKRKLSYCLVLTQRYLMFHKH